MALSLSNLAELYRAQGQYAQAEPLLRRALGIFEKALGPNYPDVALSLNNLALLYHAQGQYAQAEALFRRALAILETALGPDPHPDVATSLKNLAALYRAMKRDDEAEPLERRADRIRAIQRRSKPLTSAAPDRYSVRSMVVERLLVANLNYGLGR